MTDKEYAGLPAAQLAACLLGHAAALLDEALMWSITVTYVRRAPRRKCLSLTAWSFATIAQIKQIISDDWTMPVAAIQLQFEGKRLQDDRTLGDCKMGANLFLESPTGPPPHVSAAPSAPLGAPELRDVKTGNPPCAC